MADQPSPRVNAQLLPSFIGSSVKLPCKIEDVSESKDSWMVEAADGGHVSVQLPRGVAIESTKYVEIIGKVIDGSTLKLTACIPLGDEKNLKVTNEVIKIWHDPRFGSIFSTKENP